MLFKTTIGILIPFFGTLLGTFSAFFICRRDAEASVERFLSSFAAGIMTAASVWSLILPSLSYQLTEAGTNIVQVIFGIYSGSLLMIAMDKLTEKLMAVKGECDRKLFSQITAVTLHNIPEGMAVGLVFSALLAENNPLGIRSAFMLSAGIAVQNIPEGAIIPMQLIVNKSRKKNIALISFISGIVEPLGALTAIILAELLRGYMPVLMSFAAGTMLYVVIRHMITSFYIGKEKNDIAVSFGFISGFVLMMSLDVIFG